MKKSLFAVLLAVGITAVSGFAAYAADISYNIVYDYDNSTVTLSGTVDNPSDKENVSVVVLKKGKTYDDIDFTNMEDNIFYCGQDEAADGKYSFDIDTTGGKGISYAYISRTDSEDVTLIEINIIDKEALGKALEQLNTDAKVSDEAFITTANTYKDELGFEYELADKVDVDAALKSYRGYVEANPLKISDNELVVKSYRSFIIAQALNEGKIDDIANYTDDLILSKTLIGEYKELAAKDVISTYFTGKLSDKAIASVADFESEMKKALILTNVMYGDGYGSVAVCLEKYGDVIDITGTINKNACRGLKGKDYDDAVDFRDAYKGYSSGSGSGSGGGSGSSSGSRVNSSITGSAGLPAGGTSVKPPAVTAVFEDIEGLDWAYEAIVALKDKKIINGVGENRFNPNDPIKREEFVKILVLAANLQDKADGNVFADMNEGDWFCEVVNAAYQNGVLSGKPDSTFGAGENITRQDMCVMLYNTLKLKGAELSSKELTFDDSDDVSDYAKEALMALYGEGAVNGVSDTEIAPMGTATRAQAAKVVYLMLDKLQ